MITSTLLPTDEEFEALRNQLLARVDDVESRRVTPHLVVAKPRPRRSSRRRILTIVGSLVAASVLATAVVATGGFGIAGGIAGAQAATILHEASASAFATSDPVVGPSQYLKFETQETARDYIGGEGDHGLDGYFTSHQIWTIYQPGTTTADWVLVRSSQAPSNPVGGELTRQALKEWKPSSSQNGVWTGRYGKFSNWASDLSVIRKLPHTVAAVRAYLYSQPVDPNETWSADQQAWELAVEMLTNSYVPAELRGDLYEAMAGIPGVTVTGNQATTDGQTGVAIGFAGAHNEGQSIVIDPKTGQYLGSQEEGDVTSVTVTVVDAAPAH